MRTTRRVVQSGFLALTLTAVFIVRGNAERWCPFGGVEAAYTYLREGNLTCSLGVSNFYILAGVLLLTLLLRRAFCGYMCPIGTISEWLGAATTRLGVRPARVPRAVDRALSLLKYGVLAVILYLTWRAGELIFRGFDPCYALISRHGEDITFWAYVVAGGIVLGSLLVTIPFCRWLCPLAAVLNLFSRFGLTRIKRDETVCTSCGKCARACPMAIPVDVLPEVKVARCTSCLNCVAVCPKASGSGFRVPGSATAETVGASADSRPETRDLKPANGHLSSGALFWGPPNAIGRRWPQAALIAIMLACVAGAVAAVYTFPVASFIHTRGQAPAQTSVLHLRVSGLTCRGAATRFTLYYLDRDDEFAVPGYLKIEAWPGPGYASARITYDPAQTNELAIKQAITEPYFNTATGGWDASPFRIEGYDPLGLDEVETTTRPAS